MGENMLKYISIMLPEGEAPECDERIRKCKCCKGLLSIYNLNDYCFFHLHKCMTEELAEKENRRIKNQKIYDHRSKAKRKKLREEILQKQVYNNIVSASII